MNMVKIGVFLQDLRKEKGMTQAELAAWTAESGYPEE